MDADALAVETNASDRGALERLEKTRESRERLAAPSFGRVMAASSNENGGKGRRRAGRAAGLRQRDQIRLCTSSTSTSEA